MSPCKCGHSEYDHGLTIGPAAAAGTVEIGPVWCSGNCADHHLCQCRRYSAFYMPPQLAS